MQPKVVDRYSKEKYALELAAAALQFKFAGRYEFFVRDIYFDFGQDWWWTTIVCETPDGKNSYQILNPRDWENILTASTAQNIVDIVDKIEIVYEKYGK